MNNAIWITWEHQIRNKSMARNLDIPLFEIVYKGSRPKRYALSLVKTFNTILKNRPRTIIAQNPSIVLTCFMLLLRPVFHFKFISDAHYFGVIAFNNNRILQRLLDFCNKGADVVIVTNQDHAKYIKRLGGNTFICEDPLPDLEKYVSIEEEDKSIFFICSFDIDEPYEEVFEAAAELSREGYIIRVSGNYKRIGIDAKRYPHVCFLGFVPEADFYMYLYKASLVLDLTDNEDCLVCGAYEAMAANKPMVLSDTKALRGYFKGGGAFFTENRAEEIAKNIRIAYKDREGLKEEITIWKQNAIAAHREKVAQLINLL
jgi:glycosyltransferase involved in cell wall biosynthesis